MQKRLFLLAISLAFFACSHRTRVQMVNPTTGGGVDTMEVKKVIRASSPGPLSPGEGVRRKN